MTGYRDSECLGSGRDRLSTSPLALAVILACQLMVVLDGTVIYAALPKLRADLGLARADLSWVQNAYMLTFGGFMLLGDGDGGCRLRCRSDAWPCRFSTWSTGSTLELKAKTELTHALSFRLPRLRRSSY